MEPPRRFAKFLSALFLAAGMLLLVYVAGTWYLAVWQTAVIEEGQAGNPVLANLPPALRPVDPVNDPIHSETAVVPPVIKETGEEPVLLPDSPLIVEEQTSAVEMAAAPEEMTTDSRPQRIIIPALGVDAPVLTAGLQTQQEGQRAYQQWSVPDAYAAGWHENSAPLGKSGNTVLNGHNNVHGAIFGELRNLAVGEQIVLVGAGEIIIYRVAHHELLKENGLPLRERLKNARWIAPTEDERLTLVTCWPNTTNSHRLIVVALPDRDV